MRQFSININGKVIEENSQSIPRNWKLSRLYNIAPDLQKGDNFIIIRVTNPEGPPALLVEAPKIKTSQGNLKLSSNIDWEAAPEPNFDKWANAIPTLTDKVRLGEKKSLLQKSPNYPVYMMLFGAYILFILLAINPRKIFYNKCNKNFPLEKGDKGGYFSSNIFRLLPFFGIIVIILIINIYNTALYTYTRSGFDWKGHVDYIKYMAASWRTPLATEGWEMFQPPFYYFLSAILFRLFGGEMADPDSIKAAQIMGALSGVANACFAWLILRKLFNKNYMIQLLGFSVVAFLPMCFYMNPLVSNEIFSGSIISLSICLLIYFGFGAQIKVWQIITLAGVIGLALLSKYTATFIFATTFVILTIRILVNPLTRRQEMKILAIFLVIVFTISGWLYIRNLIKFHDPFIGNWDEKSGYRYEQHHGYRTLGFYLKFGSVFFHLPERSRWASFWDGKYGSMWMDSHGSFLNINDEKTNLHGNIIIILALLPSIAILLGFYQSLKSVLKSAKNNPNLALIMVSVLTIISLISFSMEVPFFSTIKAFFFLSLLPAMAVFAGQGLYTMCKNIGKFRFIIYINLIVLYLLIINLFWYRGT